MCWGIYKMIIKWLCVECRECGYTDEYDDSTVDFEEAQEEDWICPGCSQKVLDGI